MDDWPSYGPGVDKKEPGRRKRPGSRRMRLRTQWHNIMAAEGMPFVQTTGPMMVFEKHLKELQDLGISDDDIVESWRRFALDARRGVLPKNKHPWFIYWGRRSKYLTLPQQEIPEADWDTEEEGWI